MVRVSRTTWLKGMALVVALASLTVNFGLIDLVDGFTGYVDQARNQILDLGWGAVFGVILPLGLLSQLRRPERRIAGIQQTAVVASALALAGAAGQSGWYLALAGGIAFASAVLLALHPARRTFLARGRHPEPMMLALAAVAAVPALVYAWRTASAQRRDLPPADAVSNGLHHWTVMTALALLVLLLMLLAAARTSGWRIPALSASIAAGAWAISCLLAPASAAGSEGHAWAWAALVWAIVALAAAVWPRTRGRPFPQRRASRPHERRKDPSTSTVIRGAEVLDVRTGVVEAADILVEGALIAEVSSRGIAADGARVIDAAGTTIIPGLIDSHVHVNTAAMIASPLLPASLAAAIVGEELRGMLLRGFTTVRDVAGADGGHREAVERGLFVGPRLFVAVDALSQTGGHGDSRGSGDLRPQDRPGRSSSTAPTRSGVRCATTSAAGPTTSS